MKVLSLLMFGEPVGSGGMLVDFSGSEWKLNVRRLQLILFGSWVQSEEYLSAYSVELQDLIKCLLR